MAGLAQSEDWDFDACSSTSPPVCGKNVDGLLETFTNECTFNETQSEFPLEDWKMVELQDCTKKYLSEPNESCKNDKCRHQYFAICLNYTSTTVYSYYPSPCDFEYDVCNKNITGEYLYVDPIHCESIKCKPGLCEQRVANGEIRVNKVCARIGSEHKVFDNHCDLEKLQCEGGKWRVTANRKCF